MQPKWYGKMTTTGKSTRHDSDVYMNGETHTPYNKHIHTTFMLHQKPQRFMYIYISTLGIYICVYVFNIAGCDAWFLFSFHRFPCVMSVWVCECTFCEHFTPEKKNHFLHNELKPTGAYTLSSIEWERKPNAQMPHWFVCLLLLLNCFLHFVLTHSLSLSLCLISSSLLPEIKKKYCKNTA